MKRRYERPSAYIEEFTPNEYVAACGGKGTVYKFTCDAGDGVSGLVWLETNKKPGLQEKDGKGYKKDKILGGYHACGATHKADSADGFFDGYYVNYFSGEVQDVKVWRGSKGDNIHCTTNLDISTWSKAKS